MAGRKLLVTGASGLLGRAILKCFESDGWEVQGLAFSRAREGLLKVDLKDATQVKTVMDEFRPSVVVHSAAERRPDTLQKDVEGSRLLNVSATENIAQICKEYGCFLIYISTDYVFDGSSPPYKPDAKTNPLNDYGISKRDGEEKCMGVYKDMAILRVPILYGEIENLDESAVTTIFKLVQSGIPKQISDFERRYPTHTNDVAVVIKQIAEKSLSDRQVCQGIWHYSGKECFTKYTMALVMGEAFGIDTSHLKPVKEAMGGSAPRPYDSELDFSKTIAIFQCQATTFKDGIYDVLKPFILQ